MEKRKAIKTIALGSVWTTPIVQAVKIPTHAQTSPDTTVAPEDGIALLHISSIISNPVGGDCSADNREIISISNSGTASTDISGFTIVRLLLSGPDTLVNLSGSIAAGQTIDYDVCQGTTTGVSARLNNSQGGQAALLSDVSAIVDRVLYPPIVNGPAEGTVTSYGPTPSTTTARTS